MKFLRSKIYELLKYWQISKCQSFFIRIFYSPKHSCVLYMNELLSNTLKHSIYETSIAYCYCTYTLFLYIMLFCA